MEEVPEKSQTKKSKEKSKAIYENRNMTCAHHRRQKKKCDPKKCAKNRKFDPSVGIESSSIAQNQEPILDNLNKNIQIGDVASHDVGSTQFERKNERDAAFHNEATLQPEGYSTKAILPLLRSDQESRGSLGEQTSVSIVARNQWDRDRWVEPRSLDQGAEQSYVPGTYDPNLVTEPNYVLYSPGPVHIQGAQEDTPDIPEQHGKDHGKDHDDENGGDRSNNGNGSGNQYPYGDWWSGYDKLGEDGSGYFGGNNTSSGGGYSKPGGGYYSLCSNNHKEGNFGMKGASAVPRSSYGIISSVHELQELLKLSELEERMVNFTL
ncbi:hypothetical protein B7463_g7670, partial [Scytalidium lignicola]